MAHKQRYWMALALVCHNCGLNWSIQEGMKDITNVEVGLKTSSGNVNISLPSSESNI